MEVYIWGKFGSPAFIEVVVDYADDKVVAAREESYTPIGAWLLRNLPWIALILLFALVGGALAYLDKKDAGQPTRT
jgi:hypothetical protein